MLLDPFRENSILSCKITGNRVFLCINIEECGIYVGWVLVKSCATNFAFIDAAFIRGALAAAHAVLLENSTAINGPMRGIIYISHQSGCMVLRVVRIPSVSFLGWSEAGISFLAVQQMRVVSLWRWKWPKEHLFIPV